MADADWPASVGGAGTWSSDADPFAAVLSDASDAMAGAPGSLRRTRRSELAASALGGRVAASRSSLPTAKGTGAGGHAAAAQSPRAHAAGSGSLVLEAVERTRQMVGASLQQLPCAAAAHAACTATMHMRPAAGSNTHAARMHQPAARPPPRARG